MEISPKSNQFPFKSHHLNHLAQTLGSETVRNVEFMVRTYIKDGGCNPNAIDLVFPYGLEGRIDEEMLESVLTNFLAWHENI